jgi:hypothetical protein|tara:strand:+ start:482 stop:679 length:198 start_codon:yes stop_codon:yes gene_type:complete
MLITGKENIERYRLLVLKTKLQLEISTGMKVTRGRTAYSIIKDEFNLKGNKQKVLDQFVEMHNLT